MKECPFRVCEFSKHRHTHTYTYTQTHIKLYVEVIFLCMFRKLIEILILSYGRVQY